MSRDITPAMITASNEAVVKPALLAKLEFDSGDVFLNNINRDIEFSGDVYIGVGNFGSISRVDETSDFSVSSIELILSGIDSSILSLALTEDTQGRLGTIYLAYFDSGFDLVADPMIIYKGLMDNYQVLFGKNGTVKLTINHRLARWSQTNERRRNNTSQQAEFPADKFFERVEENQNKVLEFA